MVQPIMVQIADRQWTMVAMHLAAALARNTGTELILVKMAPVQHLGWLGTEFGSPTLSRQDCEEIRDYEATAEDYGVPLSKQVFQYVFLPEALSDAADYFGVGIVFAT